MQTFLPYPDFGDTAKVLDPRRLNKQIIECQQIFNALTLEGQRGWANHPAVLMWKGHRVKLFVYASYLAQERESRLLAAHKVFEQHRSLLALGEGVARLITGLSSEETYAEMQAPAWLGQDWLHASHRANLLRKQPEWYSRFGWTEEPQKGYNYQRALELMKP